MYYILVFSHFAKPRKHHHFWKNSNSSRFFEFTWTYFWIIVLYFRVLLI